jgi:AraC-like DNA-binding protein
MRSGSATTAPAPAGTRRLFESRSFFLGEFHCPPGDRRWREENRIEGGHLLVLPGTSVLIAHAGRPPVVANPNHTMFYNQGQTYSRRIIHERGDHSFFIALPAHVIAGAVHDIDPSVANQPDAPFPFDHGPCDPQSYLLHRRVVQHLKSGDPVDPLWVEDSVARISGALLVQGFRERSPAARAARERTRSAHVDAVEAAKKLLSMRFSEVLSLSDIASAVGLSAFHLARLFKQRTGLTLHAYRNQLRLRAALEALSDPRVDLTALALDLGYSSHSHFTDAFRRVFGTPPAAIRGALTPSRRREMSRIMEA